MQISLSKEELVQVVEGVLDSSLTIANIKHDQREMRNELQEIKRDQQEMRRELHRQGIIQEDMQSNIKLLVELVTPLLKKSENMSDFEQSLKDQDGQIKVTQNALQKHIKDRKAHLTTDERS